MIEIIKQEIEKALKDIGVSQIKIHLQENKPKFGDFGFHCDLPDKEIKKIVDGLSKAPIFSKVEATGNFINLWLSGEFLSDNLENILEKENNFGANDRLKNQKILLEFVSANPTGPLTIGNGRGAFVGETLARTLEKSGAEVAREYYVNDTGSQVENLGKTILGEEQLYKGEYIEDLKKQIDVSGKNAIDIGKEAVMLIIGQIKKTLDKCDLKFDQFFSEQSLYDSKETDATLKILKENNLAYEKEKAIWFPASKFGDDKDRVLIRKDGQPTYFFSDIAYHYHKIKRGYNLLIDIWGADHFGYKKRLEVALEEAFKPKLNWDGKLIILISQFVRLVENGKEFKVSKRAGTFVTLEELIDEVGLDGARFFFLQRGLDTHMDFDLSLAKEQSKKNPVYYVQYAYARIHGILAKSKFQNPNSKNMENNLSTLIEESEKKLIKKILQLPDVIGEIIEDYQTQRLPRYALEIADAFHNFYEHCRVLDEKNAQIALARLSLIRATGIVLKNTLDLMGISAPERM